VRIVILNEINQQFHKGEANRVRRKWKVKAPKKQEKRQEGRKRSVYRRTGSCHYKPRDEWQHFDLNIGGGKAKKACFSDGLLEKGKGRLTKSQQWSLRNSAKGALLGGNIKGSPTLCRDKKGCRAESCGNPRLFSLQQKSDYLDPIKGQLGRKGKKKSPSLNY